MIDNNKNFGELLNDKGVINTSGVSFKERIKVDLESYHLGHHYYLANKLRSKKLVKQFGANLPEVFQCVNNIHGLDFNRLPNEFVIKPTVEYASRGVMLLKYNKDKNKYFDLKTNKYYDRNDIIDYLESVRNKSKRQKEWQVITEELLVAEEPSSQIPHDFKCYTFFGQVVFILEKSINEGGSQVCWYNRDWSPLYAEGFISDRYPGRVSKNHKPPRCHNEIIRISEKLSQNVNNPFVRVDLYATDRGCVFGELTQTPGTYRCLSARADEILGDFLHQAQLRLDQHPDIDNKVKSLAHFNGDIKSIFYSDGSMKLPVELNGVAKKFDLEFKKQSGALSRIISFTSSKRIQQDFLALKNITLNVYNGENVGIIGDNGSGKSTLLRVMAGIYQPDGGQVKTNGEVIYLDGFGKGLKPKLTVRENIFLMGAIHGLSSGEVAEKFNQIVDFANLRDYVNVNVHKLSSGMVARLNFSITIYCLSHKNPDVLLLDEAFSGGGDISFREKSLKKMEELIVGGTSVVLASHSLKHVLKYCDQAIWLDQGQIIKSGEAKEVVDAYREVRR